MRRYLPLIAAMLATGVSAAAVAQSVADAAAASPQARREQLAKVQEMLADPDPLMRLANMEAIVNSGDGLRIQLATRDAFASDDADLRGLAMRAYIATHKEITFEIALPSQLQKEYDDATSSTMPDVMKRYPFVQALNHAAFKLRLRIIDYTLGQDHGTVQAEEQFVRPFDLSGDRLSAAVTPMWLPLCYAEFRPSRKQTFDGTLSCQGWPKLSISAPAS